MDFINLYQCGSLILQGLLIDISQIFYLKVHSVDSLTKNENCDLLSLMSFPEDMIDFYATQNMFRIRMGVISLIHKNSGNFLQILHSACVVQKKVSHTGLE